MRTFLLALIFLGLSTLPQANASSSGGPSYIGALLGLAFPSANNVGSRFTYGATVGHKFVDEFGLGAYFLSSSADEVGANVRLMNYGLEGDYYFINAFEGLYMGGMLGFTNERLSPLSGASSSSTNPLSIGPKVGFNLIATAGLTVGLEANMLFVFASDTTVGTAPVSSGSFNIFNLLGTLKFWWF